MPAKLVFNPGDRFGRWTVIAPAASRNGRTRWKCQCDCGTIKSVGTSRLRGDGIRSCGCAQKEVMRAICEARNATHGECKPSTKEWRAWRAMRKRCYDSSSINFNRYGGRGIQVCRQWRDSYETFLADMGRAPSPKHSIDRIDNDGDYGPNNCRIATPVQNARNSRRATLLTAFGETKPLTAWAEDSRCRIRVKSLRTRIRAGWTHEEAIATPPRFTRRWH